MLGHVTSGSLQGISGFCVDIEVQMGLGMSNFYTVGLPEAAVRESKTRVRSAIIESGLFWPSRSITLNLAPADVRKDGTAFDLPIALAILAANGEFSSQDTHVLPSCMIMGELSLSGDIRPVRGILPLCIAARNAGFLGVVVPYENAAEAALVEGLTVYAPRTLRELVECIRYDRDLPEYSSTMNREVVADRVSLDMSDVNGQSVPKRALEIAASGGHNLLFIGPPGSGKTMLSQRLPSILPEMSFEEALEVTALYSVSGNTKAHGLITQRPFRDPHHSISDVGLVGGGSPTPRPGEISLAHNGVLFLDELPEFKRAVLEVLRQPMENGFVNITRRLQTVMYPAQFMLIASMNACPCGNLGSAHKACTCSRDAIQRYQSRISGPLLDRIDLQIEVREVSYDELNAKSCEEASEAIQKRVQKCREIQLERYRNSTTRCNAQMNVSERREFCDISTECHKLLRRVIDKLGLSARSHNRILKIARTIADMAESPQIELPHLSEAISYRILDRKMLKTNELQPVHC